MRGRQCEYWKETKRVRGRGEERERGRKGDKERESPKTNVSFTIKSKKKR